jgi:hypothetical protein
MYLLNVGIFLFLAGPWIQSANAQNCASIFGVLKQGDFAKSTILHSPDGRSSAWSEAIMQKKPSVLHTTLYVRDLQTGQKSIAFRSDLTPEGHLRGYKEVLDSATYDAYCPVDWSADSSFLLVEHIRGPQGSDHLAINTWVLDRVTKKRQRFNANELIKKIESYTKTQQFRSGLYYLVPIGWESATVRRIVFAALPAPGEDPDLGIWSAEINGRNSKLLEEQSGSYTPIRFSNTGM